MRPSFPIAAVRLCVNRGNGHNLPDRCFGNIAHNRRTAKALFQTAHRRRKNRNRLLCLLVVSENDTGSFVLGRGQNSLPYRTLILKSHKATMDSAFEVYRSLRRYIQRIFFCRILDYMLFGNTLFASC